MSEAILFFNEEINFELSNSSHTSSWIQKIIAAEGYKLAQLNYIFCSDTYLLDINQEYLSHDYFTDIITFNQSEEPTVIEADIFISIDRVKANAKSRDEQFLQELHRVMIHGLLHLMGYDDKILDEKQRMRKKEDSCLSLRNH